MSKIKLTKKIKSIIVKMREGERIYKYTGGYPTKVTFETSEEKIPERIYYDMLNQKLIRIDDAIAFETWLVLTELGKTIEL